ncbi:MAG: RHS repeat-associated core domain-containing protein [Nibricoccus sp.]
MKKITLSALMLLLAVTRLHSQTGWTFKPVEATARNRSFAAALQARPAGVVAARDMVTQLLPVADEITPEITALASALNNDPVRIYEWVKNTIEFVPYHGLKRGAQLTLVEKVGNDFDTCALLVALLKASGADASYKFGGVVMDPNDVADWLGSDASLAGDQLLQCRVDYFDSPLIYDRDFIRVPHVWVIASIAGKNYVLDPSFKRHSRNPAISLDSAISYSNAAVYDAAAGSDQTLSVKLTQSGLTALRDKLSSYSTSLIQYCQTTVHDESGADICGKAILKSEFFTALPEELPSVMFEDTVAFPAVSWAGIPTDYAMTFSVTVGSLQKTFYTAELQGKKLAVYFSSGKAQLWLDDTMLVEEVDAAVVAAVTFSYTFPDIPYTITQNAKALDRAGCSVIAYGFDQCLGRLAKRLQIQSEYVTSQELPQGRKLLTENLNIIGLQYLNQMNLLDEILGSVGGSRKLCDCFAGIVGIKTTPSMAPYVDLPLRLDNIAPRSVNAVDRKKIFLAGNYLGSALEHVTLEQTVPDTAVSTVKLMQRAIEWIDSSNNHNVYYANSNSHYQLIKPLIGNYTTLDATEIAAIQSEMEKPVARLAIPNQCLIWSNEYKGTGYLLYSEDASGAATCLMGITGGLAGGYATMPNQLNVTPFDQDYFASSTFGTNTPSALPLSLSWDPVDTTNGAFYKEDTDLTLGGESPHGLALVRQYSSARRLADPAKMGKGWTHSYAIQLSERHPNDFDLRRATAAEVAPFVVAARALLDVVDLDGSPKHWLVPALIANWAGDQLVNSRTSVSFGTRNYEFTRMPKLSTATTTTYAPPAGVNATLTQAADGTYTMEFRKGATVKFDANKMFTDIIDKNNSTGTERKLSATYANGLLTRVTDSFGRYFDFGYESGRLKTVTDNTDREVQYTVNQGNFVFKDAEGKETTYTINSRGLMTQISDARGRTVVTNVYDTSDRILEQRSLGLDSHLWTYGFAGGMTRETDPLGKIAWTYFDERGRKIAYRDQLGNVSRWGYDGNDRVEYTRSPKGEETTMAYDAHHEVNQVTNPDGNSRTITPENDDSSTSRVENSFEGNQTTTEYYGYHKVKNVTATGGFTTSYTYDSRGRVLTVHPTAFAAGEVISYVYTDVAGYTKRVTATYPTAPTDTTAPTEITDLNARGDVIQFIDRGGRKTTFEYNKRRQKTKTVQWSGLYDATSPVGGTPPSDSIVSTTTYDDAGAVDYILDPRNNKVDYDYDALGNLIEVKGADGQVVKSQHYDERNLLGFTIDAFGNDTQFKYDDASRLKETIDPLVRHTYFDYDANGQRNYMKTALGHETDSVYNSLGLVDSTGDAMGFSIIHGYDKDGRPKTLKNRREQTYTWTYDDVARKVTTKTPEQKSTIVEKDTRGLLKTVTAPSLRVTEFKEYDAEGRLLKQKDGLGIETTFSYYPNGMLHEVSEGGMTTHREYDDFNRLKLYRDGDGNTLQYTYDAAGNLETITYPGNKVVTYGYDAYNRMASVSDWNGRVTSYAYDAGGRLKQVYRPNGTKRNMQYDAASQLCFVQELDVLGNVIWQQVLRYDKDGRIDLAVTAPVSDSGGVTSAPYYSATYDNDNRLETWNDVPVIHDDDGNMTLGPLPKDGSFGSYTYDGRNRLSSCNNVSYGYNPEGHRYRVGSIHYLVDPNASLSRVLVRNNGGTITRYVWGIGLVYEETDGATKTYHYNHQGSTIALSSDNGTSVLGRWEYAAYGQVRSQTGSADTPFLLHGSLGVMTESSGLVYMRARFYNPYTQRFLNADPIGFAGGMNWYAFANGNPVMMTDPEGKFAWAIAGFFIGAGVDLTVQLISNHGDWSKVNKTSVLVSGLAGAAGVGLGGKVAQLTTNILGRAVLNGVGSAVINGTGQIVKNVASGSDWEKDLGYAATVGGLFGAGGSIAGDLTERAFASFVQPSPFTQGLLDSGALQGRWKPLLFRGEKAPPTLGTQLGTGAGVVVANLSPVTDLFFSGGAAPQPAHNYYK